MSCDLCGWGLYGQPPHCCLWPLHTFCPEPSNLLLLNLPAILLRWKFSKPRESWLIRWSFDPLRVRPCLLRHALPPATPRLTNWHLAASDQVLPPLSRLPLVG